LRREEIPSTPRRSVVTGPYRKTQPFQQAGDERRVEILKAGVGHGALVLAGLAPGGEKHLDLVRAQFSIAVGHSRERPVGQPCRRVVAGLLIDADLGHFGNDECLAIDEMRRDDRSNGRIHLRAEVTEILLNLPGIVDTYRIKPVDLVKTEDDDATIRHIGEGRERFPKSFR
jgi:hypothetical protein